MESILQKIRALIEDNLKADGIESWDFDYELKEKLIRLSEANVDEDSIAVKKNGVVWDDDNYSFNADTAEITIAESSGETLEVGDNLLVSFSYYAKYSETELESYVRAAITTLSTENYSPTFKLTNATLFPTATESQENLIAVVAAILIKPNLRAYRTADLQIQYNEGLSKEKKISRLVMVAKKTFGVLGYVDLAGSY